MGNNSVQTAFDAEMRVIMACDEAVMGAVTGYAESEIFFFSLKRDIARKWKSIPVEDRHNSLSDPEYSLLVHEAGALAKAADVDVLADDILKKEQAFEVHAGICFRVKRRLIEEIQAAKDDRKALQEIIDCMVFPSFR